MLLYIGEVFKWLIILYFCRFNYIGCIWSGCLLFLCIRWSVDYFNKEVVWNVYVKVYCFWFIYVYFVLLKFLFLSFIFRVFLLKISWKYFFVLGLICWGEGLREIEVLEVFSYDSWCFLFCLSMVLVLIVLGSFF